MVHCIKGGFVRDRPVTAPNLSQYNTRILEEMRRRESQRAHTALGHRLTALLDRVYKKGRGQTYSTTWLYTLCLLIYYMLMFVKNWEKWKKEEKSNFGLMVWQV